MQTKPLRTLHPEQGRAAVLATVAPSKGDSGQAEPRFPHSHAAFLSLDTTTQTTPKELAKGQGICNEFCQPFQDGLKTSHFCSIIVAGRSEDQLAKHEVATQSTGAIGWMGTPPLQMQVGLLSSGKCRYFFHLLFQSWMK